MTESCPSRTSRQMCLDQDRSPPSPNGSPWREARGGRPDNLIQQTGLASAASQHQGVG